SWMSGRGVGVDGKTILLGGAIYDLASEREEGELADVISTAEKSLNPKAVAMALQAGTAASGTIAFSVDAAKKELVTANSTWTETSKRVLAVRLSYSSAPTTYSFTLQQLTNMMVAVSNNVKTMSYRKTWLVLSYATVDLPNDQAYYEANGPNAIVNDTATQLTAQGINKANFDIVVHAHPQSGGGNFGYAGLGVIGGGTTWVNGTVDANVTTHEIGHNYGLGHAHFWAGLTGMGSLGRTGNDGAQVEQEEYGDPYDVMGGGPMPAAHYGAHGKAALNWIEPKEVINVITNGIYRVYRFDHIDARTNANATLALKVTCPGGEEYWVAHRKLFTANASMSRGIYLVRANGSGDQGLIDTTQLSKPAATFGTDRDDAALAVGKSFVDSVGSVRITTIASGGTAPLEYLDVQVAFTPETGSYSFYADAALKTNGLVGSYVNSDLRSRSTQDDWRAATGVTIAGKRIDSKLSFTSNGWGARAPLKLTGGTDANWDNFSVQWDGYVVVRRPIRLATVSDDSSRFWIDLNNNGAFSTTAPEFVNNHWGTGQGATRGDISSIIPPGTYRIRIQYEEGNGDNSFTMNGVELQFQLFTTAERTTPGLTASFVGTSLRSYLTQNDWRTSQTITGTRVDEYPVFKANGWGSLASVGLSNGTDANWDNFSVQWDGYISNSVPIKLGTVSDDASRMWIDVNTNGAFGTTSPEYFNNGWGGAGQGATEGAISGVLQPGMYAIRIQYEEGGGDNNFVLAGVPQLPIDPAALYSALVFTGAEHSSTPRKVAGDFTIEFWLKTTQVAGDDSDWHNRAVLADAGDFGLTLGAGEVLFGVKGTTLHSPFVADGEWHYVSARRVQSSGQMDLYLDNAPVARAIGVTDLLDSATDILIGGAADGSRGYVGNLDQVRMWDYARTTEQIAADLYLSRSGRWVDASTEVKIAQLQPNFFQIFWDALSGYRVLEGATSVSGPFVPLPTDQNSTNIAYGANAMRFFRVRK
ncbi:MAG TPA: LamG-like jellyroll fold domain-containing protein, partial [Verrucomicrobiae bacterium]